jgi:hypothetical protein
VKFKTIFILFNIVIVISFLIIYLMPLFMLGWEYTSDFWARNWFLPVIFVAVIGGLNVYFISNWTLFRYLEAEQWEPLIEYLEAKIYSRENLKGQYVRILINAYLVKGRAGEITRLREKVEEKRPKLLEKFTLQFGIPYILDNDSAGMKEFFGRYLSSGGRDGRWIRWNYAFACFLEDNKEKAKSILLPLAREVKDPLLKLLSLYLLDPFSSSDEEAGEAVASGTKELLDKYDRGSWEKELNRGKDNVYIVILSRLLGEATEWLFTQKTLAEA